VSPHEGIECEDNDFHPLEAELDEFHPKATRTLFVGNLEKEVSATELKTHFEPFGEIIVSGCCSYHDMMIASC
jgi:RNA recognition motif-containing protein